MLLINFAILIIITILQLVKKDNIFKLSYKFFFLTWYQFTSLVLSLRWTGTAILLHGPMIINNISLLITTSLIIVELKLMYKFKTIETTTHEIDNRLLILRGICTVITLGTFIGFIIFWGLRTTEILVLSICFIFIVGLTILQVKQNNNYLLSITRILLTLSIPLGEFLEASIDNGWYTFIQQELIFSNIASFILSVIFIVETIAMYKKYLIREKT
ncbi:MAG: hypothetical protein ACOX56_02895 [Acholeplasmataceae bacterium]